MTEWHRPTTIRNHPSAAISNPARELAASTTLRVVFFLLLHIPLALLMDQSSTVATLHALVTFAVGLLWAISPRYSLQQIAYVGMYIVGAEVLWRMTGTRAPWEFGKYAVVAIFLVAMVRTHRIRGPRLPLIYFVLLLPAAILTLLGTSLWEARELISFNLSGPFALLVSAWFFSHLHFTRRQLQSLLLAALGPLLAIATIVWAGILTASTIRFGFSSNALLSGGFGPNQVSSVLALGALCAFWYVFHKGTSQTLRIILFVLMLLLLAQSVLTFSRGGLYNVVGSALLAAFFLARDSRTRLKLAMITLLFIGIVNYVLWPQLNNFTNGTLAIRFTDTTRTSDRDLVVLADLQIWRENPVFGVGLGLAPVYRARIFGGKQAHTEQTRMLAEHGAFGAVALMALFVMARQRIKQMPTAQDKAFVASMVGFSLLYMLHGAMRLVIPAFVFGVIFATYLPAEKPVPSFPSRK